MDDILTNKTYIWPTDTGCATGDFMNYVTYLYSVYDADKLASAIIQQAVTDTDMQDFEALSYWVYNPGATRSQFLDALRSAINKSYYGIDEVADNLAYTNDLIHAFLVIGATIVVIYYVYRISKSEIVQDWIQSKSETVQDWIQTIWDLF